MQGGYIVCGRPISNQSR